MLKSYHKFNQGIPKQIMFLRRLHHRSRRD